MGDIFVPGTRVVIDNLPERIRSIPGMERNIGRECTVLFVLCDSYIYEYKYRLRFENGYESICDYNHSWLRLAGECDDVSVDELIGVLNMREGYYEQ